MRLCIVGTGYVGLVSGVCLAYKGHDVTCVDTDISIIKKISSGKTPFYEKGLSSLLLRVIKSGKFRVTNNLNFALNKASIVIVAVGTPSSKGNIDLSYVKNVSKQIGKYIANSNQYISVVIKSTTIPGTTDTFVRNQIEKNSKKSLGEFGLGMNPEFLREGSAVEDFLNPDRIIFGVEDKKTLKNLKELYSVWDVDKIITNTRTAELIKYANNLLLATQISTVNEIANFTSKLGKIDVMDVINGIYLDKRWNPKINNRRVNPEIIKYLLPGCGFGGSCFPKDLQALRSQGKRIGLKMNIVNEVLKTNELQPNQVIKIIKKKIKKIKNKNILLLGLSFKTGTDDVRDSPAIKIALNLIRQKANLYAHDPISNQNFINILGKNSYKIKFTNNWKKKIKSMKIIIIITPWPEYKELKNIDVKDKIIFDSRRLLKPNQINTKYYLSIGRNI